MFLTHMTLLNCSVGPELWGLVRLKEVLENLEEVAAPCKIRSLQ